jgi:hypothetical protein
MSVEMETYCKARLKTSYATPLIYRFQFASLAGVGSGVGLSTALILVDVMER